MSALLLMSLLTLGAARGQEVDLLLVLCVDGSGSIDEEEFRLQRQGYATAMTDDRVLGAIGTGRRGAIAVAFVEWGTPGAPKTVLDWAVIKDRPSAEAWADRLLAQPRGMQSYNAIGDALMHATDMIKAAPLRSDEAVIDLSGDGPDLRSLVPAQVARDRAVAAGITVNALAIYKGGTVSGTGGEALDLHYERVVIGGPGAFVEIAKDYKDFGRAILNKLVREIASGPQTTRTAATSEGK
ncbi:MAG: DUF1194 domain-containing protein [Alphaproteobacteria bacterium]|nr:DUF1194 domain-containing protein [Alphaproteobacteria bacterium]